MSIFRSEQRDARKFWSWIRGLFGAKCPSYLAEYRGKRCECNRTQGHAKKHTNGKISWGYGDNWLEGS